MIASLKKGGYYLTFMILHPLCFRQHMKQILFRTDEEISPLPSKVRLKARGWREQGEGES